MTKYSTRAISDIVTKSMHLCGCLDYAVAVRCAFTESKFNGITWILVNSKLIIYDSAVLAELHSARRLRLVQWFHVPVYT